VASGVERFRAATHGMELDIRIHEESTHTAQQAADQVGAPVGAIVKSLLFGTPRGPILVLASGPNRVDPEALGERVGTTLGKADADAVKEATGYSIGGVPPFGHPQPLWTVMDEDLFGFETVWAAAGAPTAVFPISPERLRDCAGATVHPLG